MKIYTENDKYKLYHGSMLDMCSVIAPNSIDSIVTDPPYELGFMGKSWDNSGVAFKKDTWEKCFNVLKPGGYLLAFGGQRTFHRIACAIEDAGFEIRDTIMWLFGSGFPKSMNIGLAIDRRNGAETVLGNIKQGHNEFANRKTDGDTKFKGAMEGFDRPWMHDTDKMQAYHYEKVLQTEEARKWDGWGTCLKPAYEPIIVARKPLEGTCIDNILKYGTGGINIDACRIGNEERSYNKGKGSNGNCYSNYNTENNEEVTVNGRFPSDVIFTYDETDFDEVCGGLPVSDRKNGSLTKRYEHNSPHGIYGEYAPTPLFESYGDSGSAARYFYCAKASKKDRDEGLDNFKTQTKVFNGQSNASSTDMKDVEKRFTTEGKNIHPTVKPMSLMQYLIRLVTRDGGTVLDCFNGSGSTGKAVMYENREYGKHFKYIGIELEKEYLDISKARIDYVLGIKELPIEEQINDFEETIDETPKDKNGQLSFFDLY